MSPRQTWATTGPVLLETRYRGSLQEKFANGMYQSVAGGPVLQEVNSDEVNFTQSSIEASTSPRVLRRCVT